MQHVSPCQPTFKATIHSSPFPQLFLFIVLVYVYIIILTIGWVTELCFNVPLILKSYGDGAIGLKSREVESNVRTLFSKLVLYIFC